MANLPQTMSELGNFTILLKALKSAELEQTLDSEGSFTILAPSDQAFSKWADADLEALLQNVPKMKRVLLYHVLFGDVRSDDLKQIDEAPTMEGSILGVSQNNGEICVNAAQVTQFDIVADNGVVHEIDTVLFPAIIEHEYE